jgi:HlyD family secretion protein
MKHSPCHFVVPALLMALMTQGCHRNSDTADAYGNFESTEIVVSAQSQGELLSMNLEEGDFLKKGQRIGSIDSTSAVIKCRQVLAQLEVSRAKTVNLDAQLNVQEQQRKNLIREANRLDKLQKEKAVPAQQVDDIVGQLQVLDAQTATLNTQRKMIAGEMDVLKSQLDETSNLLEKCRIINPIDGTVLEKYTETGELVIPGKALYKIANLTLMELKAYVSGAQLSEFSLGDSVWVRIDKGENEYYRFPGTVSWVSSEVEFTPKIIQTRQERVNMVYAIRVRVINDGRIKIGMPGEVTFQRKNP